MSKIAFEKLCEEVGVKVGDKAYTAAILVFSIERGWPDPRDRSPKVLAKWARIVSDIVRDLGGVDALSVRDAALTFELIVTLEQFAPLVADIAASAIDFPPDFLRSGTET